MKSGQTSKDRCSFRPPMLGQLVSALAAIVCIFGVHASVTGYQQDDAAGKIDDKIVARMEEFVRDGSIAGAVTLVSHQGKIIHHTAVGKSDLEAGVPMTPDSVFAIASMTKPVTAAAVMILWDEKKINLDEPVATYLPEFNETLLAGKVRPKRQITVRDCLTHTNGLVSDQRNVGTLANTVHELARSELAFEPGTRWQYGPGLSVAGRIVEVVSGKSFDEFLKTRIFDPLEMSQTSFRPAPELVSRIAKLYEPAKSGNGLQPGHHWLMDVDEKTTPNPSGGLYSTAGDLAILYQMFLNKGEMNGKRILSREAVEQMTSVQTGELKTGFTDGNGWGLGFCVVRAPSGPTESLSPGSFGHGGAFGTQGWIDPQEQSFYILLICRQNFGNGDASDLRTELQRLGRDLSK